MSTRCLVGLQKDEEVTFIYCHHDGYLEGVGKTLMEHYGTEKKVEELLKSGDTSAIVDSMKKTKEYAYHDGSDAQTMKIKDFRSRIERDDIMGIEFAYVMTDGKWNVQSYHGKDAKTIYDMETLCHDRKQLSDFAKMYVKEYQEGFYEVMDNIKPDPDREKKESEKPKGRYSKEAKIEWSKNKTEELENTIIEGIVEKMQGDEWKNFLMLSQNFANYSVANKMLVYMQDPSATLVKGAATWKKEFDRTIIDKEKPIYIYAPVKTSYEKIVDMKEVEQNPTYKENMVKETDNGKAVVKLEYTRFKPVRVYDVKNTEGKELPPHEVAKQLTGSLEDAKHLIETIIETSPVPVDFASKEHNTTLSHAYGYYSPKEDHIVMRDDLSDEQTVKTLIHEITHAKLHGERMRVEGLTDTDKIDSRSDMEVQAESCAFIVCNELGIDTSSYSFGYIASYINNKEDIKEGFKDLAKPIFACAKEITEQVQEKLQEQELSMEDEMDKEEDDFVLS